MAIGCLCEPTELHELLWYLGEALTLQPAGPLHDALGLAFDETERLTHESPDLLEKLDVSARRYEVNTLLLRTSELVRRCPARRTGFLPRTDENPAFARVVSSPLR